MLCSLSGKCHWVDSVWAGCLCNCSWWGEASVCVLSWMVLLAWLHVQAEPLAVLYNQSDPQAFSAVRLGHRLCPEIVCGNRLASTVEEGCWLGSLVEWRFQLYLTVDQDWKLCSLVWQSCCPCSGGATGYALQLSRLTGWAPCLGEAAGCAQLIGQDHEMSSVARKYHRQGSDVPRIPVQISWSVRAGGYSQLLDGAAALLSRPGRS